MNRTAADIARAYARFATQATSELLRLGADAAGASTACLYWCVREQIIAVPTELVASPEQMKLRQQIRRDFWPWVQRLAPAADDRILVLPRSVQQPSMPDDESVILLTLGDHQGELGGIIAMCVSATGREDVLGPWREEAVGFAELVRENLLADLDRDTGLLTPASFDAEMQRWKDSADERDACACLLNLHLDYLADIEQALGADVRRKALQEVLGLVETRLRGRDLVARLGPACIGVMLKQCDLTDAKRVCDALEERLRDYRFRSGIRRFAARLRIAMKVLNPRTPGGAGFETAFESPAASPKSIDELASFVATNVQPAHTASVLHFPSAADWSDDERTGLVTSTPCSIPLRAQPCRALAAMDQVVMYRLRGLFGGGLEDPAPGSAWQAAPATLRATAGHTRQQALRDRLADVLEQISRLLSETLAPPVPAPPLQRPARATPPAGERVSCLLLSIDTGLVDAGIVAWLVDTCQQRRIRHSLLCLSISEVSLIADVRRLLPVLGRLHRAGFKLCVETGGAGIESPALMRRLSLDYLQASTSLSRLTGKSAGVPGAPGAADQKRLLAELVEFANSRGCRVLCGGVDSDDQARQLHGLGVQVGHGRALGASIPLSRLRINA